MSTNKHWTEAEENIICQYYQTSDWETMLNLLPNRSPGAIRVKACYLGIRRNKESYEHNDKFSKAPFHHLSETEMYYLAGIIDGEGYIGFQSRTKSTGVKIYSITVTITNTDPVLMNWLTSKMPGVGHVHHIISNNKKWKDSYRWYLTGSKKVSAFLREIAPCLVIKKQLAELLGKGYVHLTDKERELLYREVNRLRSKTMGICTPLDV